MTVGTNDLPDRIGWGDLQGGGIVMKPFNGQAATVGNGAMVSLATKGNEQVDRIHKIALENGGSDEGEPGPRAGGGFYAAYFRDLDGNKSNAFVLGRTHHVPLNAKFGSYTSKKAPTAGSPRRATSLEIFAEFMPAVMAKPLLRKFLENTRGKPSGSI